jgi:hypothetical protein
MNICPWSVKPEQAAWLNKLALPWNEESGPPHTHPIHAAIRNWTYKVQMPKIVKGDCTFIGMKPEHFDIVVDFMNRKYKGKYRYKLLNPVLTAKDLVRYHGDEHECDELDPEEIDTEYVWFDESGHHLDPAIMMDLHKLPKVEFVGYSSIFPLTALSFEKSPHPEFADWRLVKESGRTKLVYAPDGDWSNPYTQTFDPTMILAKEFVGRCSEVLWSGGVVETKGNTRLHLFSRKPVLGTSFVASTEKSAKKSTKK